MMASPITNVTAAPRARNTPNGTRRFFLSDSGTKIRLPSRAPRNTVNSTPFHPTNEPTIAIILMSPPPIASSLNAHCPTWATANSSAKPTAAPSTALRKPSAPPASDMATGSRTMQTFRKLPRQSPRSPAATSRIGSTATRHLVEQDASRHGDVERLRARRQRDRHALRGDGVELRADPRAFVPYDDGDRPAVDPSPFSLPRSPAERLMQRCAVRRRRPQRDRVLPRPADEPGVVERQDRVAEGRTHRCPQRLGPSRIGGPAGPSPV